MDINSVKIIRNNIIVKEIETNKSKEKKKDIKGCLKLVDYMAF